MSKTALITGASKGIGKELAFLFAEKEHNLVLVARSAEALEKIKVEIEETCPVSVHTMVVDLCGASAAQAVFNEVKEKVGDIDYLVNNAGFGDFGYFADTEWERHRKMIELNISTLSQFCHLFIQDWIPRKSGKILNVASTAAFQPGPGMSVYFASKAYVANFSQAIAYEFRKYGITVTTLCPGPVKTNFGRAARMNHPNGFLKDMKTPLPEEVVSFGYRAMMKGKALAIHGVLNKFVASSVRFLPRKWLATLSAKVISW